VARPRRDRYRSEAESPNPARSGPEWVAERFKAPVLKFYLGRLVAYGL